MSKLIRVSDTDHQRIADLAKHQRRTRSEVVSILLDYFDGVPLPAVSGPSNEKRDQPKD